MSLHLDDPQVDELAREVAELDRCSVEEAVNRALKARLDELREREERRRRVEARLERIWKLPVLDDRDHAEMLYDEDGIPK
jgi:hypothetical protein